ncbi:glycosyl transferase family 28 [Pseudomonas sp. PDM17]|uniref:glycosyltransferase n=1 Tax=Pseudomonas sp. PDM17 TaxID=2769285 RepID=UPI00177F2AE0|nr:glycosyltransferase [Pseudomonas sp. PDM17]MBD9503589.1 glycosyl transferase family 28 [Pseudomonas sp. PDM17]
MKIFVTVGTQLPFPRLIKRIDELASSPQGASFYFSAQVGNDPEPYNTIQTKSFLDEEEYDLALKDCDLIISHAGMGTLLSAKERNIPLLIVPRNHLLHEHRNSHQADTARWLEQEHICRIIWDVSELTIDFLKRFIGTRSSHSDVIDRTNRDRLLRAIELDIQS